MNTKKWRKAKMTTCCMLLCMIFLSCGNKENPENPIYESIGVYGGSISMLPASDSAKLFWQRELDIPVITHGVGGAGFTQRTVQPNIPAQIDQSPAHDIIILWCSTNDFWGPVENEDRYSPNTQNGGMRIAIEKLKAKNPDGIILGFCSLPFFRDGEVSHGASHVEGQIKVFEEYEIPCLNQFGYFTADDVAEMYMPDKLHFTIKGYMHIRERQLEYIRQHITR